MSEASGKPDTSKEALAGKKVYSLSEAKEHTTEEDCWVVISGKVYDVTKFLDEHPGGYDIILTNTGEPLDALPEADRSHSVLHKALNILNVTGQDATESFEEIGHSNAARELLNKYEIGDYEVQAVRPLLQALLHAGLTWIEWLCCTAGRLSTT